MTSVQTRSTIDSGTSFLGKIPSDWTVNRGAAFLFEKKVRNSGTQSTNYLSLMANRGIILYSEKGDVGNKKPEDLSKCKVVEKGDFVLNSMNYSIGSYGVSPHNGICSPVYVIMGHYADKAAHGFINYILSNKHYQTYAQSFGTGILDHRRAIGWDEIKQIPVALPPLEEQTAIAKYLDRETARIDGLIEKKTRFIALLNDKEKAAISRLVRVGIDPKVPMTDSGVEWRGPVPTHWIRGRMKNHFKQVKRQGFEDLTVLSVYREFGVIEKSSRTDNINKTPEDLSKYQLVEPNDLAINKMKAWQGSMGVSSYRGITSPDYVVMKPVVEHDPRYMHHYLRAHPMPWVYRLISNGIRTDQWRMEPEKFLELPIFLPPMDEQRQIADRIDFELERIRGLIEKSERSIVLLREKRAALITAAVTGKIDVRRAA